MRVFAGTGIALPVLGFLRLMGRLSLVLKVPKFESTTLSPFLSASFII